MSLKPFTEQRNALQRRFDTLTVEHHRVVSEHQRLSVLHDDPRAYLADRFLSGDGIEIGALHRPTTVPETARVRYLDRCGVADLRAEYPELHTVALVEPDLLDDGERLAAIPSESLDFIIANHFLEHCEDPIGTLETFRNRLRPSGRLFLAVPDMRRTFDSRRPVTTLDHLVRDHVEGPEGSRAAHYDEYVALVEDRHGDEHTLRRDAMMTQRYPIHFHTFTPTSLRSLLAHCNFSVLADLEHDDEVIVVAGA